jgi:hypothetical protein
MKALTRPRVFIATLFASASLLTAVPAASAAQQNGLVNVDVGDVNVLNHVGIGVAANVVAQACGIQVPVAVAAILAAAGSSSGGSTTVCTSNNQLPVTVSPA